MSMRPNTTLTHRHHPRLLEGTRAYLSGPMDFVASRAAEAKYGWRNRVSEFLRSMGVTVFDPWNKPQVRGFHEYGREGVETARIRHDWTFANGQKAARQRARISGKFWETLHIDLRMVDTADFIIAYCPTNIYSVGTPHEIVVARQQRKPVLFVSPPVTLPSLERLRDHLARTRDRQSSLFLEKLVKEGPIKDNPKGVPSLWYLPLVGTENFFDGFGFADYVKRFRWKRIPLDQHEKAHPPQKPLLPLLKQIHDGKLPLRWDNTLRRFTRNDDWLLLKVAKPEMS